MREIARARRAAVAQLAALLAAAPLLAQTAPQVSVALDPAGPVSVGTPVTVTATVLVPTFMPDPPVWPDLEIADAVTRLPERATHPVTRRIGRESWSGVSRSWQITPQRPADYDLGTPTVAITWADPDTSAPVTATLALPAIAFSATVPPGAEGIDPFLSATSLTVSASVDGLPAAPKPGDAFTLTLTTTASGPPAMLLPPLAGRLPAFAGLRAYPREPVIADGDPATRTEAVAYVIEAPGSYVLPALSLDWWDTGARARQTATTEALTIEVPAPAGWKVAGAPDRPWLVPLLLAAAVAGVGLALWRLRRRPPGPPSEAALWRSLRRSIRSDPPDAIRRRLADWAAALAEPPDLSPALPPLAALERQRYGPSPGAGSAAETRTALRRAVADIRQRSRPSGHQAPLPPLNPDPALAGRHGAA